jgi:hypothetical protein
VRKLSKKSSEFLDLDENKEEQKVIQRDEQMLNIDDQVEKVNKRIKQVSDSLEVRLTLIKSKKERFAQRVQDFLLT